MPLYEHECQNCGEVNEVLAPISSRDASARCTKCGRKAERTISGFNTPAGAYPKNLIQLGKSQGISGTAKQRGPTAVIGAHGSTTIKGCRFENGGVGVSVPEGFKLTMSDNEFVNVRNPVEVRGSKVKKSSE